MIPLPPHLHGGYNLLSRAVLLSIPQTTDAVGKDHRSITTAASPAAPAEHVGLELNRRPHPLYIFPQCLWDYHLTAHPLLRPSDLLWHKGASGGPGFRDWLSSKTRKGDRRIVPELRLRRRSEGRSRIQPASQPDAGAG